MSYVKEDHCSFAQISGCRGRNLGDRPAMREGRKQHRSPVEEASAVPHPPLCTCMFHHVPRTSTCVTWPELGDDLTCLMRKPRLSGAGTRTLIFRHLVFLWPVSAHLSHVNT